MTAWLIFSIAVENSLNGNQIRLRIPTFISPLIGCVGDEGEWSSQRERTWREGEASDGWVCLGSEFKHKQPTQTILSTRTATPNHTLFSGKRWSRVLWRIGIRSGVEQAVVTLTRQTHRFLHWRVEAVAGKSLWAQLFEETTWMGVKATCVATPRPS